MTTTSTSAYSWARRAVLLGAMTLGAGGCSSCRAASENMVLNDPPATVLECSGFEEPGYARMSERYRRATSLDAFRKDVKKFPRHAEIARARMDGSGGARLASHRKEGATVVVDGKVTYPEGKEVPFTSVLVQETPGDYRVDSLSFGGIELR